MQILQIGLWINCFNHGYFTNKQNNKTFSASYRKRLCNIVISTIKAISRFPLLERTLFLEIITFFIKIPYFFSFIIYHEMNTSHEIWTHCIDLFYCKEFPGRRTRNWLLPVHDISGKEILLKTSSEEFFVT